jgi:uncharacterized protein (DUF1778 family)
MSNSETRSERVDVRMTPTVKRTLRQAAAATNKTLSEFLVDTSLAAAFEALADGREFRLDGERWSQFMEALASPPTENPRLARLLSRRPPWRP